MIETDLRLRAALPVSPAPPEATNGAAGGEPGEPAAPETREADERSVNLGRRFFNAKTAASFLIGIAILVSVFRVTSIHPSEILAQLRQLDFRLYALAIAVYATTFA